MAARGRQGICMLKCCLLFSLQAQIDELVPVLCILFVRPSTYPACTFTDVIEVYTCSLLAHAHSQTNMCTDALR